MGKTVIQETKVELHQTVTDSLEVEKQFDPVANIAILCGGPKNLTHLFDRRTPLETTEVFRLLPRRIGAVCWNRRYEERCYDER